MILSAIFLFLQFAKMLLAFGIIAPKDAVWLALRNLFELPFLGNLPSVVVEIVLPLLEGAPSFDDGAAFFRVAVEQ